MAHVEANGMSQADLFSTVDRLVTRVNDTIKSLNVISVANASLGIGTGATLVRTNAPARFLVAGKLYTKATTDNLWSLSGFNCGTDLVNKCWLYLTSAGTASIGSGTAGASAAAVVMPTPATNKAIVGTLQVTPGTGNFTGGTHRLNSSTIVPAAVFQPYGFGPTLTANATLTW